MNKGLRIVIRYALWGVICTLIGLISWLSLQARAAYQTRIYLADQLVANQELTNILVKYYRFEPLPLGGRMLLPTYRLVALYGVPDYPALGVLGEQPIAETFARAKEMAAQYQPFSDEPIQPTLEIIASVASAFLTEDGDYSQEIDLDLLDHWVAEAYREGVYIILDLQPGYDSFPDQARYFQKALVNPHVGLALDPEWRLRPGQQHLRQIGSVAIDEVNQTAQWLADLTKQHRLPQKLFLIHQFALSMVPDRHLLDTSREELAYLIQMDGQGSQGSKDGTWQAVLRDAPLNVYFGWKNFYDEDSPAIRNPQDTMAVTPKPYFVSYQ